MELVLIMLFFFYNSKEIRGTGFLCSNHEWSREKKSACQNLHLFSLDLTVPLGLIRKKKKEDKKLDE